MTNDITKRILAHKIGPGGLDCSCCTDYSYKSKVNHKKRHRRLARRMMKHQLKNEALCNV